MRTFKILKKVTGMVTLITFVATFFITVPAKSAIPLEAPLINVSDLTVPLRFGEAKDNFQGKNGRLIVHVQDAHCNYSAQQSLSNIIDYCKDNYGIDLVFLEGGQGRYDLSVFTQDRDEIVREKVSDYFVREGRVSGAEYFAINNPEQVELFGIETPELYYDNLRVYRDSLKFRDEIDRYLAFLDNAIVNCKLRIYNESQKALDEDITQYKNEEIGFQEHIEHLKETALESGVNIESYPNFYAIINVLDMEHAIDFKRADKDRYIIVDRLKKVLPQKQAVSLLKMIIDLKNGEITKERFYSYLFKKAKLVNIDYADYPALVKYSEYVKAFEILDRMKVLEEMERLADEIMATLRENNAQMELYTLDKKLELIKDLFNVHLAKTEYDFYSSDKKGYRVKVFREYFDYTATQYGMDFRMPDGIDKLDLYRGHMENFFDYSLKRDQAFLKNIEAKFKKDHKNTALLVTGGFHTSNLKQLFKNKGYSYVEIMPKLTTEKDCPYFNLLAGEVSPVEILVESSVSNIAIASMLSEMGIKDSKKRGIFDLSVEVMNAFKKNPDKGIVLMVPSGYLRISKKAGEFSKKIGEIRGEAVYASREGAETLMNTFNERIFSVNYDRNSMTYDGHQAVIDLFLKMSHAKKYEGLEAHSLEDLPAWDTIKVKLAKSFGAANVERLLNISRFFPISIITGKNGQTIPWAIGSNSPTYGVNLSYRSFGDVGGTVNSSWFVNALLHELNAAANSGIKHSDKVMMSVNDILDKLERKAEILEGELGTGGDKATAVMPAEAVKAFRSAGLESELLEEGRRLRFESINPSDIKNMERVIQTLNVLGLNVTPITTFAILDMINTESAFKDYAGVVGFEVIRGIAIQKLQQKAGGELPESFLEDAGFASAFRTWIMRAGMGLDGADIKGLIELSRETSDEDIAELTRGDTATAEMPIETVVDPVAIARSLLPSYLKDGNNYAADDAQKIIDAFKKEGVLNKFFILLNDPYLVLKYKSFITFYKKLSKDRDPGELTPEEIRAQFINDLGTVTIYRAALESSAPIKTVAARGIKSRYREKSRDKNVAKSEAELFKQYGMQKLVESHIGETALPGNETGENGRSEKLFLSVSVVDDSIKDKIRAKERAISVARQVALAYARATTIDKKYTGGVFDPDVVFGGKDIIVYECEIPRYFLIEQAGLDMIREGAKRRKLEKKMILLETQDGRLSESIDQNNDASFEGLVTMVPAQSVRAAIRFPLNKGISYFAPDTVPGNVCLYGYDLEEKEPLKSMAIEAGERVELNQKELDLSKYNARTFAPFKQSLGRTNLTPVGKAKEFVNHINSNGYVVQVFHPNPKEEDTEPSEKRVTKLLEEFQERLPRMIQEFFGCDIEEAMEIISVIKTLRKDNTTVWFGKGLYDYGRFYTAKLMLDVPKGAAMEFDVRGDFATAEMPTAELLDLPSEYMDMGGAEADLDIVQQILDKLEKGNPFKIIGGGVFGKTENLITALTISGKTFEFFDLRGWTVSKLSNTELMSKLIADANTPKEIRSILSKEEYRNKPFKTLKKLYTHSLELKRVETYLVEIFRGEIEEGLAVEADVVVFDEFDMEVNRILSEDEVKTAGMLMDIAKDLKGKQVVAILHPPAMGTDNDNFRRVVNSALGSRDGVDEIDMEYLQVNQEKQILDSVGVTGELADTLMFEMEGLPAAYLPILINKNGIRDDINSLQGQVKVNLIHDMVAKKIRQLAPIILGDCESKTRGFILSMAVGVDLPVDTDKGTRDSMKRTMLVREDSAGNIRMSPIVKDVLKTIMIEELRNSRYISLGVGFGAGDTGALESLLTRIEVSQGVRGINNNLVRKHGEGLHMIIINPYEMFKARRVLVDAAKAEIFLRALYQISNSDDFSVSDVGALENKKGEKTFFAIADVTTQNAIIAAREILGFKHETIQDMVMSEGEILLPHVTIGFTDKDFHDKENTTILYGADKDAGKLTAVEVETPARESVLTFEKDVGYCDAGSEVTEEQQERDFIMAQMIETGQ